MIAPLSSENDPPKPHRFAAEPVAASALLHHVREKLGEQGMMTIGELLALFGVRGFAFLLLVLALLNIAIFMVPGLSLLFGLPMIFLSLQMVLGRSSPILPSALRHRVIKKSLLIVGLDKGSRLLEAIEPYLKPRFFPLSGPVADRIHSCLALLLSGMVALPIPFFNLPPTFAVVVLAIGIMQRDGIAIAGAYALGAWSFFLFDSLGDALQRAFGFL